jgi:feruloyl esterase
VRIIAPLLAAGIVGGGAPATVGQCSVAAMQASAPADTTIVSAERLTSPVPHCRVEGYVTATNPGPNRDNFRLQLPERGAWNGRFYFIGVGGAGGFLPTESQTPRGNPIVKGFAVAGTDKGHQGDVLDWSFNSDPVKALDNAHRAAHLTTLAAQRLTRAYYGARRMFRYETGCSGGGDMGIRAMQDHPEDYDGVLLGWPGGHHPDPRKDGVARNYATMLREVMREPGAWVSPAKRAFAEAKALEACDIADGARDEMIWDHRLCRFDFTTLLCRGGDAPDCLTRPEATTLNNIIRQTAAPISNMTMWGFYLGDVPPPWNASASPDNVRKSAAAYVILNGWARLHLAQPDRDVIKQPLSEQEIALILERQAATSLNVPGGRVGFEDYARRGGKAIFFTGVSDPCCSNVAMEQYFIDVANKMGWAQLERTAKYYEVPGWGHCGGGTGPDDGQDRMLQALIDWVEQGRTPQGIVMHRGADRAQLMFATAPGSGAAGVTVPKSTGRPRDFLVCPFPMIATFDPPKVSNPEAVYDAMNWTCRPSPPPRDKART